MSSFGGNSFGGGRSNSSWGGGGRNSGRGRSSGRGGRGGRGGGRNSGRGGRGRNSGRGRGPEHPSIKLHAKISASTHKNQNNNNNNGYKNYNQNQHGFHPVTSVAIWETGGNVKIFTGGKDGFWRLWSFNNQSNYFDKEFEHQMGGPVDSLVVASNFLFCGFEGISKSLPEIKVGMIHAWNLASPNDPPLEFHMQPNLIPYAHATAVKKLTVVEGQKIISGSKDGSIKLWAFEPPSATNPKGGFMLKQNILGHAREITGLVDVGSMLWSCSTDGSIRIWDMAKPDAPCQHCISMASNDQNNAQNGNNAGPGHTNAVTGLVKFASSSGNFVLSCSLDGTVKAWNGGTGQCVASEYHNEGVVTMSMIGDMNGKQCLLIGCESGTMFVRNLEPTAKVRKAFDTLLQLHSDNCTVHNGAVRSLCQGPAGTFYTSGDDGRVFVYQVTADIGL